MEIVSSYNDKNVTHLSSTTQDEEYQNLLEAMKIANFLFCPIFDGKPHRYDRDGTKNVKAVCRKYQLNGKVIHEISIRDYKWDENHIWRTDKKLSAKELKELKALNDEEEIKRKKEEERIHAAVAEKCQTLWDRSLDIGSTPYLEKKLLPQLNGARIDPDKTTDLIVPLADTECKLWNVQRILPEKYGDRQIDKIFEGGGRVRGLFHTIGKINPKGRIFIAEGFATGASIHEATGHAVVVAFNAGNLLHVAKAIRGKYPEVQITIAGDNDLWTKQNGILRNIGREKAIYAGMVVGAGCIFPSFKDTTQKPTDFNDLRKQEGIQVVKEQLLNSAEVKELVPLDKTLKGKIKQQVVANILIGYYGDSLKKQERDLFLYDKTHWHLLTMGDEDELKAKIQLLCNDRATANEVRSIYELFLIHLKSIPSKVNMFSPNPLATNFTNGTLRIKRDLKTGKFSKEFAAHNPADYLTWVIPFEYVEGRKAHNFLFEKTLDEIFEGDIDKDKAEKIRSLKQCAGSMLLPAFPQIFFFDGKMGSRKTTIAKLFMKLLASENISAVEPFQMDNFLVESMIGKLVNVVTDIDCKKAFPDAFMKRNEDRVPVLVNRKGKKAVLAMLPGVHVYNTNKVAPTMDGEARAYNRRCTFIRFNKNFTENQTYIRNYEDVIFESGPEGILDFALEGLDDLLGSGAIFFKPTSSQKKVEQWQAASDVIGQFLEELEEGYRLEDCPTLVNLELKGNAQSELYSDRSNKELRIKRSLLFKLFQGWLETTGRKDIRLTDCQLFEGIRERGWEEKKSGTRYFLGIGVRPVLNSIM